MREGARAMLALESDIEIVGEAVDGPSAIRLARQLKPDLILLDNSMPGMTGLEVSRWVASELPQTGIIFLTMDPALRDLALAGGATAYVLKDAPSSELLRAVRATSEALTMRRRVRDMPMKWARAVELLLAGRVITAADLDVALGQRLAGESIASTMLRAGIVGESELADALARASATPLFALAPYPELADPIHPTDTRLASPRMLDPIDRTAARRLPRDFCQSRAVVLIAASRGEGVVAMADPLDDESFADVERRSGLRLSRVTTTLTEIHEALDRAWSGGDIPVISTGNAKDALRALAGFAFFSTLIVGLFLYIFRDGFTPRHAFAFIALACGFFFFAYALKYYLTTAAVLCASLFADSLTVVAHGSGTRTTNGDGRKGTRNGTRGGASAGAPPGIAGSNGLGRLIDRVKRSKTADGYKTLRGEKLDERGKVQVADPWPRIGEHRLPAERQPFVSVHLALYNERRVVDRLLAACTSFDYENYEVIVVDDSTDETVEALARWRNHPRVRVIHRPSRSGFKGGALQEALRRMNPRTEYVAIFDADFIPPADAIWHFLDYFGRLPARTPANGNGNGNGNGHPRYANGIPLNGERLAAVQGYQWHMLNASENWITKGVRAEFAGSYVLERAGQELFGTMKMISGSVYMIRADVLRKLGWSTSITEDWELTIRLYLAGYKVLYTPYIQAPAECVSTIRRLIKQRMRWAEGHTYNVKKYFGAILRSPNLTWREKLEFFYYVPYYLQAFVFGLGTLSWLLGVFLFHQRLPMWTEVLGWSLVVTNVLALPLMNLAGVLLEGSLRRDALGLLSFIGLSWLLVPFQGYAAVKGLVEREEGGWVRTPKSGRVTEALAAFRLARLLPWELPRRRTRKKAIGRAAQVMLHCLAIAMAASIVAIGALSVRAAAASGGGATETDYWIPVLAGTAAPLALVLWGWLKLHRRLAVVFLAFCLGLSTNVVYLANAVPAAAVTDNSSVFTFQNSTTFYPPNPNMRQNYTPTSPTATTCPATSGFNWQCSWTSDTFTTGQSMSAGTAQVDLYASNTNIPITRKLQGGIQHTSSGCGNSLSHGAVATGDVLLFACTFRGGTGTTITSVPSGWNLVGSRVDSTTAISLVVYSRVVTDGATEPPSNVWGLSASVKLLAYYMAFSGVDNTNPIDAEANQATPSDTSHTAPGVTSTVANDMLLTFHSTANCVLWSPPPGMTEVLDSTGCTNANSSNVDMEINQLSLGAAGPTGDQTATNDGAAVGVTKTIALRPVTAPLTCALTVQLSKPIQYRSSATAIAENATTITINKPGGVADGDVMIASIGQSLAVSTMTITPPAGWTLVRRATNGGGNNQAVITYLKVASGEPANYVWSFSEVVYLAGGISAYIGVDNATPINAEWGGAGGSQAFTTTTVAGAMLVASFAAGNATFTPPAGMNEAFEQATTNTTFVSVEQAWAIQAVAGATGVKTATVSSGGVVASSIVALRPAAGSVLGTATVNVTGPGPTLISVSITTAGTTFVTGDRLQVDVVAPNDQQNCGASISYDSTGQPSRLTTATIVPEALLGLLMLAPALPLAARWWKRRRP